MLVTRMPRDSRIAAREAAAMPFPREETTPPVTKTYFVIYPRRVGMEEFTTIRLTSQMSRRRDAPCLRGAKDARFRAQELLPYRGGQRRARSRSRIARRGEATPSHASLLGPLRFDRAERSD